MHIPEVDMWNVSKCSRLQRQFILKAMPPGLATVDYAEIYQQDMFYLDCQEYRDYSRDPYNKVHVPARFKVYMGKCAAKEDTECQRLLESSQWRVDRQPIVFPIEYPHDMALGRKDCEFIKGRNSKYSNLSFKR